MIDLTGKKILLGVTGGIAAYKAIDLASRLHKAGAIVKTVLTKHALEFITALNFSAITHDQTFTDNFTGDDPIVHITLADWADLVVVMPATANIIAKAANGIADDLLSTVIVAHTKPILFVPAMNVNMYNNVATQSNILTLTNRKHIILEPQDGLLACGYTGKGKLPPIDDIFYAITTYCDYVKDLQGLKLLISAGATKEAIDPMRFISNNSSGKMGIDLAMAATLRGAEVVLVYADVSIPIPYNIFSKVKAITVKEMHENLYERFPFCDALFMCAAVSDFTIDNYSPSKIKKSDSLTLNLIQTTDILLELVKIKKHQTVIGFAAETDELVKNAEIKLKKKRLDYIIANQLTVAGNDETEIHVISSIGKQQKKPYQTFVGNKFNVAHQLLSYIFNEKE